VPARRYIGLGISTLDTLSGTWRDRCQTATGPLDVPGRCLVLLTDATMLLLDRRSEREFGAFHIHCNHDLNFVPGQSLASGAGAATWLTRRPAHAEHLAQLVLLKPGRDLSHPSSTHPRERSGMRVDRVHRRITPLARRARTKRTRWVFSGCQTEGP
jgi:hypothetical protein